MLVEREATSINMDAEPWKEAKIQPSNEGITFTELLEIALRKEMGKRVLGKKASRKS
jgi:hypothetical protein